MKFSILREHTRQKKRFRFGRGRYCFWCGERIRYKNKIHGNKGNDGPIATRDHVLPKSKGGGGGGNIVPACPTCNHRKGNSTNWIPWHTRQKMGIAGIGPILKKEKVMPSELDYKSRVGVKGGSPKGRDVRDCPKPLKDLARKLAIQMIGDGNESYFINNPNAKSRFSIKAFRPIVPLLYEKMPAECEQYFGGREENAAYLIMERVHKMYYYNDGKHRGRGKSNEHPDFWSK